MTRRETDGLRRGVRTIHAMQEIKVGLMHSHVQGVCVQCITNTPPTLSDKPVALHCTRDILEWIFLLNTADKELNQKFNLQHMNAK